MDKTKFTTDLYKRIRRLGLRYRKMNILVKLWTFLLLISIVFGGIGLFLQITKGHGVTGMRDHVVWGYFIVNFVYFIGVSYGAALIAAILYHFKVSWGGPIIRISTLLAFITGIIAPIFILLCIGRFDRLHYLIIYARVQSPITWDVLVISTYLVGITIFTYMIFFRDFGQLSKIEFDGQYKWRNRLYKILSLGIEVNENSEVEITRATKTIAFIIIPKIVLAYAVLSWIFGMTLRPGWHSTIFGPAYIISSVATSVGLIIGICWIYRKLFNFNKYFSDELFRKLALIMVILVAIFGYFTFTEYITSWYVSDKWGTALTNKLLGWGKFGIAFHLANFFGIVLPIGVLFIRKFRTTDNIAILAVLMVIAMWVRRYLVVVPTLETTLYPMQDIRPEFISYSATWVEWTLVIAGAATFFLFFTLVPRIVNIIPFSFLKKIENQKMEV